MNTTIYNPKNTRLRWLVVVLLAVVSVFALIALMGCSGDEYNDRRDKQNSTTLKNSLGIEAQKERLSREDDTTAIRYVYLMNFGQIVGYYVIKGGVYGADTQLAPEQEIICRYNTSESCQAVDSAKDDGTYGGSDSGVFFITSDNILVETTLDYIQSDQPLAIDVPRLDAKK